MSRSEDRRLDKIEGALTPKQAFLHWMAEAHQHETFAEHVLWLKDLPVEEHPYRKLTRQIEHSIEEANKKEKPARLDSLVRGPFARSPSTSSCTSRS